MRFDKVILPVMFSVFCAAACAQVAPSQAFGTAREQIPVVELGANYTFFHANAPPAACGCFSLNGGGGTIVVNAPHGLSLLADLSGAHANKVNGTTQNITLFNYLFGPRYSYRSSQRFTPYAEVLLGRAMEISNYAFVQNASSLGLSAGGGVSTPINRLIGWNIVEADYVYSRLPNNVNNRQNTLRVSSGITFRFGPR